MESPYVALEEAATILGIDPHDAQAFYEQSRRGRRELFPTPAIAEHEGGPMWDRELLEDYARRRATTG